MPLSILKERALLGRGTGSTTPDQDLYDTAERPEHCRAFPQFDVAVILHLSEQRIIRCDGYN